ncbi:MAG TPA: hypothetical protein VEB19_01915 [Gemmatimonadaceae bacterium]|nr:hypothetical protein [Gemmatimonadaceae bacterium]
MKFPRLIALAALGAVTLLPSQAEAQKRQRDRITREEILESPYKDLDLYQVIRNIRPHFLEAPRGVRSTGNSIINPIVVYIDGRKDTGLDALKLMAARDAEDVRYFEPSKSMAEFGPTANGGAVVIKRYKAPKQ